MKIQNPAVTLNDEARTGISEQVRSGFLDWLYQFSVTGDDGELYSVGGSILSLAQEKLDVATMNWTRGKGQAVQLPNSIYKLGKYPGMLFERMIKNPQGTLCVQRLPSIVRVSCGLEVQIECRADCTWHILVNSQDGEYRADLYHRPHGFPLWYGRETPSYLTQHSVTYGYNWAGDVDGTLYLNGKEVKVTGRGIRERYVAVDSSAAELGGWEDWGWIAFDEMASSFYDMRLGKKDLSVYDTERNKNYPEGHLSIKHSDWVFLRELDGFIPTVYQVRMKVEDGIYEMHAHVCNATTWGTTHRVPDYPVATLTFDVVEGTFASNAGTVKRLTNGRGVLSVRQWHAYPNILPQELYMDEQCFGERFDTL